ncbi:hypothetical protein KM043_009257 [Ampulex compressa]|nr:hypothetical protein KM043_009257 [Ampulex compressa]
MFETVAEVLAKRGHRVDVISYPPPRAATENYTNIASFDIAKHEGAYKFDIEAEEFDDAAHLRHLILNLGNQICKHIGRKEFQRIVKEPPRDPPYDLVLVEYLTAFCYMAFGWLLNVPVVGMSAVMEWPFLEESLGYPPNQAFYPRLYSSRIGFDSFWEKTWNLVHVFRERRTVYEESKDQNDIIRKYISKDVPEVDKLAKNVALVLMNTHHSFHGSRPHPRLVVEVGGLHIEEDSSKMSPKLQKWMDTASSGVVYFSFGSLVNITHLPANTMLSLYASFAKIAPVKVLMKIKNRAQIPAGLPENVLTLPWIPQIPVLGHRNTKVFVTHGGLMSIHETLYHAVPVIGIPVYADQGRNINLLVSKGVGVKMKRTEITEASMDAALNALLNNPKYKRAAERESARFKDRPMRPIDTAIFWIEYVVRNGQDCLRSPAVELTWWQLNLLDVYAFLATCVVLGALLLTLLLKITLQLVIKMNVQMTENKQKVH